MIITCDFDHTLRFENGETNQTTLDLISTFDAQIIIISTRKDIQDILDFIVINGLTIKEIVLVSDEHEKLKVAKSFGTSCHFDDSDEALSLFDNQGILTVNCFNSEEWDQWLIKLGIEV